MANKSFGNYFRNDIKNTYGGLFRGTRDLAAGLSDGAKKSIYITSMPFTWAAAEGSRLFGVDKETARAKRDSLRNYLKAEIATPYLGENKDSGVYKAGSLVGETATDLISLGGVFGVGKGLVKRGIKGAQKALTKYASKVPGKTGWFQKGLQGLIPISNVGSYSISENDYKEALAKRTGVPTQQQQAVVQQPTQQAPVQQQQQPTQQNTGTQYRMPDGRIIYLNDNNFSF